MNTTLQTFDFRSNPVRIVGTPENPLFVAADVCRSLEIQNTAQAVQDFDDDEKGICNVSTPGGFQEMLCITQPGLYRLILKSRKETAKEFQRWVLHDVLPQIHRHGFYVNADMDFEKYPIAKDFSNIFHWMRNLEISPDVATDMAKLILRSNRKNSLFSQRSEKASEAESTILEALKSGSKTYSECWKQTQLELDTFKNALNRLRKIGAVTKTQVGLWSIA